MDGVPSDGLSAQVAIICTASNEAYAQALCFLCFKSTFVCVMLPEHGPEPISSATLCPISDLVLYFVRSIPEYALSSYLNASTK